MWQKTGQPKEMGKVLDTYNVPGLNQEEIDNLSRSITSSKIEFVTKNNNNNKTSQQTKVQDWKTSEGDSIKHIKKNLYLSFSNYSKKLKRMDHPQIYSKDITFISKPEKNNQKYKIIGQYFDKYRCKILNKISANKQRKNISIGLVWIQEGYCKELDAKEGF